MAKSNDQHKISVSKAWWQKGYVVKCSKCGKLGRGVDDDRHKARIKAWNIGQKHRDGKNGVSGWLGF
jgi:hypothetical protein